MQRVMVIGSGGAGKSTMAEKLSALTGIEAIHLDKFYWQPGWIEPDRTEWRQTIQSFYLGDRWIIDGNYIETMDLRIERADTIIYLDFNRWICLYRVFKRYFKYRGKTRPSIQAGCPEKIDLEFVLFILRFPNIQRPAIYDKISGITDQKKIVILKSTNAVNVFLNELNNASSKV